MVMSIAVKVGKFTFSDFLTVFKKREVAACSFPFFFKFQRIPKDSNGFQRIPKDSKGFQRIPKDSKGFQKFQIPRIPNSKGFQKFQIPKDNLDSLEFEIWNLWNLESFGI
jgi:hypothetical protein